MAALYAIAMVGGLITGFSPCIVPVLPIIVSVGATDQRRGRPILVMAGLVASFSVSELLGSVLLSALGLPQDLLYWLGIAFILTASVGLVFPEAGRLLERPFSRITSTRYWTRGGGFLLGASLGLVFVPCAGPVLAAISVAAADHRINTSTLLVTVCYSVGVVVPLLIVAVAAQHATAALARVRRHSPVLRRVAGLGVAVTAILMAFGLFGSLQRSLPGFTSALENRVESSPSIARKLQVLSGESANRYTQAAAQDPGSALPLLDLGPAPAFSGITGWLNTPGDRPLTLAGLRGKVVLIDFWTYSCINCQRSLPHVEAWERAYRRDGLVVVGIETPEFDFERVRSNVESAARSLGVDYPIALDNNYSTWNAYNNEYWPAEYLLDGRGDVRAYHFSEGDYSAMESDIRWLLAQNGAKHLPARTDVADLTPTGVITPESYLGYVQEEFETGTPIAANKTIRYRPPSRLRPNTFAFDGTWTDHAQEATAGSDARILLRFDAHDVYLVVGGNGVIDVSVNGRQIRRVEVGGVPRLYVLLSGHKERTGLLTLDLSNDLQAYDITFG